jgi:transcriptional regulator with XRE-family HTH domain
MKRINDIDKHVGTRLRMRRLMLDMSQAEVANALGVTFQQVQKYAKGSNRVSASRLQYLCKILDVPMAFFFDGVPQIKGLPSSPDGEREFRFQPPEARLIVPLFTYRRGLLILPPLPPLPPVRDWSPPWRPLTPSPPYGGGERRIVPRHHVLLVGRITLGTGASVDCSVRNFSPSGAALWLTNAANLPAKFDLHFDNTIRHCIVVWRRPYWIGVKFKHVP